MEAVDITRENFETVINDNSIVIFDFWAPWCGPCKTFKPIFEAAAKLHPDVVFGKINTEVEQELADIFGIRSIPTIAAFRDQIGVYMQPGALSPAHFENLIAKIKTLDMEVVKKNIEKNEPVIF